jgi:hypothetical protein
MEGDKLVSGGCIAAKLKENLSDNITVSLAYKKELKNATVMFVHYLMTYADEIAKEKGVSQISIGILKEALMETDFSDIARKIEEEGLRESMAGNEEPKKRGYSELAKKPTIESHEHMIEEENVEDN